MFSLLFTLFFLVWQALKYLIKEKKEALEKKAQNVAIKAYQQNQGQAQGASEEPKKNDDGTVDAEYEDIN